MRSSCWRITRSFPTVPKCIRALSESGRSKMVEDIDPSLRGLYINDRAKGICRLSLRPVQQSRALRDRGRNFTSHFLSKIMVGALSAALVLCLSICIYPFLEIELSASWNVSRFRAAFSEPNPNRPPPPPSAAGRFTSLPLASNWALELMPAPLSVIQRVCTSRTATGITLLGVRQQYLFEQGDVPVVDSRSA